MQGQRKTQLFQRLLLSVIDLGGVPSREQTTYCAPSERTSSAHCENTVNGAT